MKVMNKYLKILLLITTISTLFIATYYNSDIIKQHFLSTTNNDTKDIMSHMFRVKIDEQIKHITWTSNTTLLIDTYDSIYSYDTESSQSSLKKTIDKPFLSGKLNNQTVYITWKNRVISNPSEYATTLNVYDLTTDEQIYNIKLHQTVKPIEVEDDRIIMTDNYPNSPNRYWSYSTSKKTISTIDFTRKENYDLTNRYLYVKCSTAEMKIPAMENVTIVTCNQNKTSAIVVTNDGIAFLIK
jgi:hypothetical protein